MPMSIVKMTRSAITLMLPGSISTCPQVATARRPNLLTACSIPARISAMPATGSRRRSIGVVPACPCAPCSSTRRWRRPTIVSTTPTFEPVLSSCGPCSMCSSTKASMSSRAASVTASGSIESARIASARVVPDPSRSDSASCDAIWPSMARLPQRLLSNRLPSFSQIATTSRFLLGRPYSRSRPANAAIPAWMPAAPSNAAPLRTVSMCEPVSTVRPPSVPASLPKTLPTASRLTDRPACSIHTAVRSTAAAHAGEYSPRKSPPPSPAPMTPRARTRASSSSMSMSITSMRSLPRSRSCHAGRSRSSRTPRWSRSGETLSAVRTNALITAARAHTTGTNEPVRSRTKPRTVGPVAASR